MPISGSIVRPALGSSPTGAAIVGVRSGMSEAPGTSLGGTIPPTPMSVPPISTSSMGGRGSVPIALAGTSTPSTSFTSRRPTSGTMGGRIGSSTTDLTSGGGGDVAIPPAGGSAGGSAGTFVAPAWITMRCWEACGVNGVMRGSASVSIPPTLSIRSVRSSLIPRPGPNWTGRPDVSPPVRIRDVVESFVGIWASGTLMPSTVIPVPIAPRSTLDRSPATADGSESENGPEPSSHS